LKECKNKHSHSSWESNFVFVFQGARHAFAEAVGRNIANPTAVLISGCNMLKHIHLDYHAKVIEDAVHKVIKAGKVS
jgi:isocitrate dehydrogenase (NAD+)